MVMCISYGKKLSSDNKYNQTEARQKYRRESYAKRKARTPAEISLVETLMLNKDSFAVTLGSKARDILTSMKICQLDSEALATICLDYEKYLR